MSKDYSEISKKHHLKNDEDSKNENPESGSHTPGNFSMDSLSSDDQSECVSTEGEESNRNLHSSVDLSSVLNQTKSLVGDYIELKNCKKCGSMVFKDQSSAIKNTTE